MKKLITKIRHKLIRALGGEIPVLTKPPLVIEETISLSVIEARQYVPAEEFLRFTPEDIEQDIEKRLAVKIGEEIIKACGVKQGYNDEYNAYCFRVAVEVTGRSFKRE